MDGSWPGGSGRTKVQHQRLTGIHLFYRRTDYNQIINYKSIITIPTWLVSISNTKHKSNILFYIIHIT